MSDDQRFQIAKEYIDKQLETMKQFGAQPRDMSKEEYKSLIEEVAESVKA